MKVILLFLLIILLGCPSSPPDVPNSHVIIQPPRETNISWISQYEIAEKIAKQQQKPLFIYLTFKGCGACETMSKTTFKDSQVIYLLNNKFVPVLIDPENIYFTYFMLRASESAVPAYVIVSNHILNPGYEINENAIIGRGTGYVNNTQMFLFLNTALALNDVIGLNYIGNNILNSLKQEK